MTASIIDTAIDGHIHTSLCHHAQGTMEEYVRSAIERGLKKLIFLEHLEAEIKYFETTWLTDEDFDLYFQEGRRLREKYKDKIEVGLGVEVGYNPEQVNQIHDRLAMHQWDRIAVSYHFLRSGDRHLNLVSSKQANIMALDKLGVEKVITAYFKDLRKAVLELPGNVLCHFDAVLRHHPHLQSLNGYDYLIDELLDAVAQKNMAVEVNTSGYKIRNEPFPSLPLLRKVTRRGIPLVAGSDAHLPQQVGRYFDRLEELGRSL